MTKKIILLGIIIFLIGIIWCFYYFKIKSDYRNLWFSKIYELNNTFESSKEDLVKNMESYEIFVDLFNQKKINWIWKNNDIKWEKTFFISWKDLNITNTWSFLYYEDDIIKLMNQNWLENIINQDNNLSIFSKWIIFSKWNIIYKRWFTHGYLYYTWDIPKINYKNYDIIRFDTFLENWVIFELKVK